MYKGFMYCCSAAFMLSFNFVYLGLAHTFEKILVGDKTICLFEQYERGGESGNENVCRLHFIDKKTGKKKDRNYIGQNASITGIRNDTLCYISDKNLVVFDATNLKTVYEIKFNEWDKILPELSVGLESISDNQNNSYSFVPYIELNCKNGKKYWFEPFSKKILHSEPKNIFRPEFIGKSSELCIYKSYQKQDCFLRYAYSKNGTLKRIVPDESRKQLFQVTDSSEYIEPFFLCIDTLKKVFVFGHYTTTDKQDFLLEAKDFNFKSIWKKTSVDLEVTDSNNINEITTCKYSVNILYFNCGGFIIAMDPLNGSIIWRTRL
ncbi:MAG: hypothetical protein SFY56_02795 [Bacteroidota bacterium]|nr:hypothetical protein [Bacteroidota bacterium]